MTDLMMKFTSNSGSSGNITFQVDFADYSLTELETVKFELFYLAKILVSADAEFDDETSKIAFLSMIRKYLDHLSKNDMINDVVPLLKDGTFTIVYN